MKPQNKGFTRLFYATGYSWKGIKAAWQNEAAFRQEMVMLLIMTPAAILLPVTLTERLLLLLTAFAVVIVELLNSAIEAVVDKASPEHHHLAGRAKDMGSAAVLFTLIITIITWGSILWPILY